MKQNKNKVSNKTFNELDTSILLKTIMKAEEK